MRQLVNLPLKKLLIWWLIAACAGSYVYLLALSAKPFDANIAVPATITFKNTSEASSLPMGLREKEAGYYYITFKTGAFPASDYSGRFRILVDDCLERLVINDLVVDLTAIKEGGACNLEKGLVIDLSPYLTQDTNQFAAEVKNNGGPMKFSMLAARTHHLEAAAILLLLVLSVPGVILLMLWSWQLFKPSGLEAAVLGAANIVFLLWIIHTLSGAFANDYGGHIDYINYIAEHQSLPHPKHGWLYYHPPLFYKILGWWQNLVTSAFPTIVDPQHLRYPCLILFNGFLLCSIAWIRRFKLSSRARLLALCMVCLWPAGLMMSGRIDSNALLYLCVIACILMLERWRDTGQPTMLAWALLWFGVGLATRTNAMVLIPVFCVAAWLLPDRFAALKNAYKSKSVQLSMLAVLAGAALNFGRTAYYRVTEDIQQPYVIGNASGLAKYLFVDTEPKHFLSFSPSHYFSIPFEHGATYSDNFWHLMIKTSAFGEFHFWSPALGFALSAVVLVVWAVALIPLLFYKRDSFKGYELAITLIVASIAALACCRIALPAWPANDFRYIYFSIIPLVLLYLKHIEALQKKGYGWQSTCLEIIGFLVVILGVTLYLGQVL